MRGLFWSFPIPPFLWIELTPYIYMYVFSILLVPGWHLECPHHLFFQNLPVQKVTYSKQKVRQNYLYIYIHLVVYLSKRIAHKSFCVLFKYTYIYIYIYLYLYVSMFGCRYPTHKTCRVQQKLRPSRTPTHWSLTKREPTLRRIRLMTCDRHFFWFLQRICRHRKNRRHRNAGNTEYIHVKDRFFAKKCLLM